MKKKLRLPILLLAVVIMLSIFYIKEAKDQPTGEVNGDNLQTSTLNPDFTEARLLSLTEASEQIAEWEESIASGTLSAQEVLDTTTKISNLKKVKHQEAELEQTIIELNQYQDVLVLLDDEYLVIDIYTADDIEVQSFIEIAKIAKQSFGSDCVVKLKTTNIDE